MGAVKANAEYKTKECRYDIFPVGVLAALGALEGKTAEEMAQLLLVQEEELGDDENAK